MFSESNVAPSVGGDGNRPAFSASRRDATLGSKALTHQPLFSHPLRDIDYFFPHQKTLYFPHHFQLPPKNIAPYVIACDYILPECSCFAQGWDEPQMPVSLKGIEVGIHRSVDDLMEGIPEWTKVAVTEVRARDFERYVRTHITRQIERNLTQLRYDLYDRDNMSAIIRERGFQDTTDVNRSYTDRELIALGETAKVEKIIVAFLEGGDGVPYTITLQMIDVKTAQKEV